MIKKVYIYISNSKQQDESTITPTKTTLNLLDFKSINQSQINN